MAEGPADAAAAVALEREEEIGDMFGTSEKESLNTDSACSQSVTGSKVCKRYC